MLDLRVSGTVSNGLGHVPFPTYVRFRTNYQDWLACRCLRGHRRRIVGRSHGRRRLRDQDVLLPQRGRAMTAPSETRSHSTPPRNRLLAAMAPADYELLLPRLQPAVLELRQVFEKPNEPIQAVYFVEHGMASVVANTRRDRKIEVGIIGREGMSGVTVVLGITQSPNETFVQVAGAGLRIGADHLRAAMDESATLQPFLLRYAQALMVQTAQTALANGRARIGERLARWLLMAHDRSDGDDLPLTHEFLAIMLGVRREGVTIALQRLEGVNLIRARRGLIVILDRNGLETCADGSYGVSEVEYERLIGS